ncbi:MAG TPA: hypothetical protein VGK73_05145, partial [Polyangiaceae bacterium]
MTRLVRGAVLSLCVLACSGTDETPADARGGGAGGAGGAGQDTGGAASGDGGTAGTGLSPGGTAGTSASDAGAAGTDFTANGDCGLAEPAFCDTFEQGARDGGRSGELDPERWSVLRAVPSLHPDLEAAYEIQPALLPECREGLSGTRAVPDGDTVICEPTATIATRHFLGAVAAQNYGLNTYRVRQPFDFA